MLKVLAKISLESSVFELSRKIGNFSASCLVTEENCQRTLECFKSTTPRMPINPKADKTFASVLIPICVDSNGDTSILYTRRSGKLSRHVRQISFPGGIKDPTDKSFEDCALRETEEEIGLSRDRIKIWGTGELIRPPLTAAIMPVIGTIENINIKELKINEDEVDEVFTIRISELCSPGTKRHTQFKSGYSAPVFVVGNYRIWGITGLLTNIFLNCFLPKSYNYKYKINFVKHFRHNR